MDAHTTPAAYLIVTGDVEVAPGRFARGIVSSSTHASPEAAQAQWDKLEAMGLYEEPFETYEIRAEALTLEEAFEVEG